MNNLSVYSTSARVQRMIASVLLLAGVMLMIFMVVVEDEPGALPLALIAGSSIWMILIRVCAKRQGG